MASPILGRVSSVPAPLDVPGPFEALLSQQEAACALERIHSTPLSGDEQLRTLEIFIEVQELNGEVHELGWFRPEESLGEIKREASKEMCVPVEALKLVKTSSDSTISTTLSDASLVSDSSSVGEVWRPHTPGAKLNAVVQMPSKYEETLMRKDDLRVHENVYDQLVTLACEFESVTAANVNLAKRIINIIENALHNTGNLTSRGWAIAALTKLLKHFINQFRLFDCKDDDACREEDCFENLKSAIESTVKVFEKLSHSDSWLERQEASEATMAIRAVSGLEKVCSIADIELSPGCLCATGLRAQLGGA